MESSNDKTRQVIKIASLDDVSEKRSSRFSSFPSPCRIFCGKGGETDSACLVPEELKDYVACCAEKATSIIREHPLKSMGIIAVAGFLMGRCFSNKS